MIQPAVQHAQEPLNVRSLLLRIRKTIWVIPAAVAAGALIGALIYSCIWLSFSGQRQYEQTSKYYLTFGVEENGDPADYYNAYTWNDLLFSIPAIYEVIEDGLPDGMELSEAREAIEAEILSDVRVLTIVVTHSDPQTVQQLTNAVEDALVRYGRNVVQFDDIEFLSSTEVEAVIVSDRTRNAVLLGAVLGLLVSALWLWIRELLDDGIYVPEDSVRRYGIPTQMILSPQMEALPDFLCRETQEALQAMARDGGSCLLTGTDSPTVQETARQLQDLMTQADAAAEFTILVQQDGGKESPEPPVGQAQVDETGTVSSRGEGETGELQQKQGRSCPVLLVIPFGRANGTRTEHLIEHLRAGGTEIDGIVLSGADAWFLAKYYGAGGAQRSAAQGNKQQKR